MSAVTYGGEPCRDSSECSEPCPSRLISPFRHPQPLPPSFSLLTLRSHPPLCQPTLWGKFLMLVRLNKILYLSAFLHIVPLRTFLYSEVVADLMRRSEITQRGLRSPLPAFPQGDISHAYQGGSKKWTHTNLIHVSPTPHRCNSTAYTVTPHLDEVSKFSVSKFAQTL